MVVAALLALTGCVQVPTSGPVQAVPSRAAGDSAAQQQPDVQLLPPAPTPNQPPSLILSGFLLASASVADNHAAARKYLTAKASAAWDADAGVTVYDSNGASLSPKGLPVSDGASTSRLALSVVQVAQIDASGTYRLEQPGAGPAAPSGAPGIVRTLEFSLVQVDDQWRLDDVPAGTLLSAATLSLVYQPYEVYLVNRARDSLVPEQVFLPSSAPDLATVLVRRVLAGPGPELTGAASTAGAGVELKGKVTPGADQVAVPLSASAAQLDGTSRRLLAAQLIYTLRQLPSISTLRLLAGGLDGQPLRIPDAGLTVGAEQLPELDPGTTGAPVNGYYVDAHGRLVDLGRRQLGSVSDVTDPAVRPDLSTVAGLHAAADGTAQLLSGDPRKPLVVRATGSSFTAPSWGSGTDGVWSWRTAAVRTGAVLVADDGSVTDVPLTATGGRPLTGVTALRISRDSARAAVVAGPAGAGRLYVGTVVAEAGGLAVRNLAAVAPSLVEVDDMSWQSRSSLVVLGRQKDGQVSSVWQVPYDGSGGVQPVTVNGASPESVAAAPGQPLLIEATGKVWKVEDGTATSLATGATPVYPG